MQALTWNQIKCMDNQRIKLVILDYQSAWSADWVKACEHPGGLLINIYYNRVFFIDPFDNYKWEFTSRPFDRNIIAAYPFDSSTLPSIPTTNKGMTKCLWCKCTTEKRRDFSDFSIREFCPRCKK